MNFLEYVKPSDVLAIVLYDNDYQQHTKSIKHLLTLCNHLHVYQNEPIGAEDSTNFANFIKINDYPSITYYADCVLNFSLERAKFIPHVRWFIDEINYYTATNWGQQLLKNLLYTYNKPYKFDMLLGAWRPHRDFLWHHYQSNAIIKNNTIATYFKDNLSNGVWLSWANPTLHSCKFSGDIFSINGEEARASAVIPLDIYNRSYYSIVAETTYYNEYNHYTEKVAKPILAQRPFVVFAGQYYLKNLKKLGFKTFDPIIDESYDNIPNNIQRWTQAMKQVERLCTLNPVDVITSLKSILEFNQHYFLSTDWMLPTKNLNFLTDSSL